LRTIYTGLEKRLDYLTMWGYIPKQMTHTSIKGKYNNDKA